MWEAYTLSNISESLYRKSCKVWLLKELVLYCNFSWTTVSNFIWNRFFMQIRSWSEIQIQLKFYKVFYKFKWSKLYLIKTEPLVTCWIIGSVSRIFLISIKLYHAWHLNVRKYSNIFCTAAWKINSTVPSSAIRVLSQASAGYCTPYTHVSMTGLPPVSCRLTLHLLFSE